VFIWQVCDVGNSLTHHSQELKLMAPERYHL
jgi:hypothetical protein